MTRIDHVAELLVDALDGPDPEPTPAPPAPEITVFSCGRRASSAPVCETPHCLGRSTASCAFPTPKGKHPLCGRRLCDRCRETVSTNPGVPFCGPHARVIRAQPRRVP